MRYLTLNISENASISIDNDLTGKESIYYNGELMSTKRSFLGSKHHFSVTELGRSVNYEVSIFLNGFSGVGFEIKRNDALVMSNKISFGSKKDASSWNTIIFIFTLFIAGGLVGYGITKQEYSIVVAGLFLIGTYPLYSYLKFRGQKATQENH